MDGVLHLVSPDPPIRRNTQLPVEAACASEQGDDQTLLRVDAISKQYADQVVLADVFLDVQASEIIGIIGPRRQDNLLRSSRAFFLRSRATFNCSGGRSRHRADEKACFTFPMACDLIRSNRLRGF